MFETFMNEIEETGIIGIRVTKDGKEILSKDYESPLRRNLYSASKSYVSLAVGLAVSEGLINLDEKVVEAFKDECPKDVSDNLKEATIRDLLTMCLGNDTRELMARQRVYLKEKDWIRYALKASYPYKPNTKFVYSNVGPYLAGVLVERRSGQKLVDYLMPRLFEPLDIYLPTWEVDPLGNTFGAAGLMLGIDEFHKLGLLCLNHGNWNGKQLLPEAWLKEATKKQVENDKYGYGYLFWKGANNSYRADGMYGQFSIVYEDKNLVVTITAFAKGDYPEKILEYVDRDIYQVL